MEILLAWRCEVPADRSTHFLDGFEEETSVPSHPKGSATNKVFFGVGFEAGEYEAVVEGARAFLRRNALKLRQLREMGGSSEMDFGVLVGADPSYAPSLVFESSFLAELAGAGVELRVSSYPTSTGDVNRAEV